MNKGEKILNRIKEFRQSDMILNQLQSYRNVLDKTDLANSTVLKKMGDLGEFIVHMDDTRLNTGKVRYDNIDDLLYNYVLNGYYTSDSINVGTIGYRRAVHKNIRDGLNYIYEGLVEGDVVKKLSKEQIEVLDEISINKFFKGSTDRDVVDDNYTIQTKLIEDLGIKVYFDDNDKPYVLSHELSEVIGKENKIINRALKNLLENIEGCNFVPVEKSTNFTMVEGFYSVERKVGKNIGVSNEVTYRISKDLLFMYLLGLTGKDIVIFKMKYIDAFNYIEEEHKRLMKRHMELKKAFLDMYNSINGFKFGVFLALSIYNLTPVRLSLYVGCFLFW